MLRKTRTTTTPEPETTITPEFTLVTSVCTVTLTDNPSVNTGHSDGVAVKQKGKEHTGHECVECC